MPDRGRVLPGHLRLTSPDLLRALMNRYGYSLADLAVVADTHRSAISHLISGRVEGLRADRAERVAAALNVATDVLFVPRDDELPTPPSGKTRDRPAAVQAILAGRSVSTDDTTS